MLIATNTLTTQLTIWSFVKCPYSSRSMKHIFWDLASWFHSLRLMPWEFGKVLYLQSFANNMDNNVECLLCTSSGRIINKKKYQFWLTFGLYVWKCLGFCVCVWLSLCWSIFTERCYSYQTPSPTSLCYFPISLGFNTSQSVKVSFTKVRYVHLSLLNGKKGNHPRVPLKNTDSRNGIGSSIYIHPLQERRLSLTTM